MLRGIIRTTPWDIRKIKGQNFQIWKGYTKRIILVRQWKACSDTENPGTNGLEMNWPDLKCSVQIQLEAPLLTNPSLFCLRLFGDESDLQFWNVAAHYIKSFSQARQLSVPTPDGQTQPESSQSSPQCHLDICHDMLCESSFFQVQHSTHTIWRKQLMIIWGEKKSMLSISVEQTKARSSIDRSRFAFISTLLWALS